MSALCVTALSATSLAACGGGDASSAGGGTLIVETSFNLKTSDPGRMFEPTGLLVDRAAYDTLLTFAKGDMTKPVPDLATSFTASPDATTFTFTLRAGATFADGTPVTAADVVFSLRRVANLKGNPSFLMAGITVSAPNARTVVLRSATPNPAIPFIVPNPALGIVNSKVVKAAGGTDAAGADKADKAESALNKASAGSGPYVISSFNPASSVSLKRNPKYWGAKPKYDTIVVRNVAANVQKLDVVKGTSQIAVDLSPAQAQGLTGVTVQRAASPNVFFVYTNSSAQVSKATSNPDFQEAVRYGIDYQGLLQLAGTGSVQAAGVIPSMFLGSLPASQAVRRDVTRAKAALARSGLGRPTVTMSYPSDLQVNGLNFGDLAARVKQNLADVGITVDLKPAPTQTALDTYRNGKDQMGLWYWGPDFPDPSDYLAFLPGATVGLRAKWAKGADAALEALGAKAQQTTDSTQRRALYTRIQTTLNDKSPFMPLIQPAQLLVNAKSLTGVHSNALWQLDLSDVR
ncbi:peptide/nickel transport system substrate-binding protein [Jatrophihabitans endophyticus]|uniref:Peptide/nickel transport system substrate-binding protein n=1 Tax=Jatrophihabitans endophyticus TaxID=1206085 RepID=A0A1M5PH62_9ACTN|nr:ABC transporter substrate-binding protein [Jatrophihabitans endophyticus]SHH01051.1 peptide/nickel transport system substrate-binding protein [Jatrophihabitans endophyticus]